MKIIASFYFSISFLKISCKVAFLKKEIYIYIYDNMNTYIDST